MVAPTIEQALRAWGRAVQVEAPLGGGNRNETWSVRIGGRRYVARRSRRETRALTWELDLLTRLRDVGLRVPEVVSTVDGRRQVQGLVVFTWLEGEPPRSETDWRAVVAALDRLHAATSGWEQRPGFCSTQQLLHVEHGGDVHLRRMPPEVVTRCRAAWAALADEPLAVVHGDPGSGNLLVSREGVGLVDWDEARVDAAILDFADLPLGLTDRFAPERVTRAKQAADAWEVANAWWLEPAYARRRLARLVPAPATASVPVTCQ